MMDDDVIMISHYVTIGSKIVTKYVQKITCKQTIETDSDPGKITIVLANPHQIFTNEFVPQLHKIFVQLTNDATTPSKFTVFSGKVTDSSADLGEDVTVNGECDIGHLADYLPMNFSLEDTDTHTALTMVLKTHSPPITPIFDNLDPKKIPVYSFDSEETYQSVLEQIVRDDLGGVYYVDEDGLLRCAKPENPRHYYDVSKYTSNPNQTKSIMGFCNKVEMICYRSLDPTLYIGYQTGDHENMVSDKDSSEDHDGPYSIDRIGPVVAPVRYAYNIHDQDACNKAAEDVLDYYKFHEDALTKITVEGMAPNVQSFIEYKAFIPITGDNFGSTGTLRGIVQERDIEYSIDGWTTDLVLKPFNPGEGPTEEEIEALKNEKIDIKSPMFDLNTPFRDDAMAAYFTGIQGRIADDGTFQFTLIGNTDEGFEAAYGWVSFDAVQSEIGNANQGALDQVIGWLGEHD